MYSVHTNFVVLEIDRSPFIHAISGRSYQIEGGENFGLNHVLVFDSTGTQIARGHSKIDTDHYKTFATYQITRLKLSSVEAVKSLVPRISNPLGLDTAGIGLDFLKKIGANTDWMYGLMTIVLDKGEVLVDLNGRACVPTKRKFKMDIQEYLCPLPFEEITDASHDTPR